MWSGADVQISTGRRTLLAKAGRRGTGCCALGAGATRAVVGSSVYNVTGRLGVSPTGAGVRKQKSGKGCCQRPATVHTRTKRDNKVDMAVGWTYNSNAWLPL
jgi:hypothetical protein